MRFLNKIIFSVLFGLISILYLSQCEVINPYQTLGVSHRATVPEIKQAYKRLARKWHPDKNKDEEAQNVFIDVNKAYDILMDPERKDLFDRFGKTEDTPNFKHAPDYSQFKRYEFDPFENLFNQGGGGSGHRFQFNFNQGSVYHKNTITAKAYETKIIPLSSNQPYLIIFYGDLCFPCLHVEPVWQKIMQELEPLGVGFASIHSQHENSLSRKLGVNSLPYLVGIIDGQVIHYKDGHFSLSHIVDFCRKLFPYKTVISVDENNLDDFLKGWSDNRVRVILFSKSETLKLRYLLVAYRFLMQSAFAHVQISHDASKTILQRYGVNPNMESLLVFNENATSPIATLSMRELAPQTMIDVLEANKYLLLPRLSSQLLFDQLCPPDTGRPRKHLCVVLITKNTQAHDPYRASMREFIRDGDFTRDRIRFMFLYQEKQEEFVKALSTGDGAPTNPTLHVVVLWRKESDRVRYQWLESPWLVDITTQDSNSPNRQLEDTLNVLVETTEALPYDAKVSTLTDEYAHGILRRLVNRLVLMGDVLRQNITRQELLPAISVLLSVGFIILVGYLMSYLVQLEEQNIQEKYRKEGKPPQTYTNNKQKLNIHELRGETYNGLVRLLKPGCRTVILIVDAESKPKLLPKFYKVVHPYRKNKTLLFAFLMVEKNLEWYKRTLQQTLGEDRELNINPKNCIGTVLSLNGHRKYFCVYHAKHEEPGRGFGFKSKSNVAVSGVGGATGGEFIGFEDTSESETSDIEAGYLIREDSDGDSIDSVLFQEHLLDGLPNWLDRLFEGSTQRYYIQFWPENMK